ncbi:hypothetical protein A6R68_06107, partial [Neotoma lepida]
MNVPNSTSLSSKDTTELVSSPSLDMMGVEEVACPAVDRLGEKPQNGERQAPKTVLPLPMAEDLGYLRWEKMVKKIEISQHTKYPCSFCRKTKMKRRAVGIWHYASCIKTG